MILKVQRSDPATRRRDFSHYDVKVRPGMTVLSALFHVQDRLDPTLAFRYSCRGAVCGACAMLINKVPRLACRTQLRALIEGRDRIELKAFPALGDAGAWNPGREVLIEPLPLLHVVKDLVVDMRKFFMHYRLVKPTFQSPGGAPNREQRLDPSVVKELEPYTNCVLCAACYSACPVDEGRPNYLGPAALAKLYRFAADPREGQEPARLETANQPDGWWACEFHANCRKVCPKGVTPNLAIGAARNRLKELGKAPLPGADDGLRSTECEVQTAERRVQSAECEAESIGPGTAEPEIAPAIAPPTPLPEVSTETAAPEPPDMAEPESSPPEQQPVPENQPPAKGPVEAHDQEQVVQPSAPEEPGTAQYPVVERTAGEPPALAWDLTTTFREPQPEPDTDAAETDSETEIPQEPA